METVWTPNDEIWIGTPPNTNDLDLLAVQWMMGMGDSYRSQRMLG